MFLNSSVFRGASFKISDLGRETTQASRISAMPAVKQLWPLRNYSVPQLRRKNTMTNPLGHIFAAEEDAITRDKFSTHVMTQVDKLHAKGCKSPGAWFCWQPTCVLPTRDHAFRNSTPKSLFSLSSYPVFQFCAYTKHEKGQITGLVFTLESWTQVSTTCIPPLEDASARIV